MKVYLLPPPDLPVPAVKGGAVETLIDHLLSENESYGECQFFCQSVFDQDAFKRTSSLRYSTIHYLKHSHFFQKIWGPFCGLGRRLGIPLPLHYSYFTALKDIKKHNPDLVVAEGGNLNELEYISRAIGKKHCAAHLHMHIHADDQLQAIYQNTIAISQFVAEQYAQEDTNLLSKCLVVPNCVDIAKFSPLSPNKTESQTLRKQLGYAENDFVILFCGRICAEKGIEPLVRSFEFIPEDNIKLLVIGSPFFGLQQSSDFFDSLKEIGSKFGDRIQFIGFVHNEQLPAYYRMANAACFPALWDEPAGITAIEAMACGCPIIATDSGGMPEYLENSKAIILKRNCTIDTDGNRHAVLGVEPLEKSIANAVQALYASPSLCQEMSAAGIERAQNYSSHSYYSNFLSAVHSIVNH